MKRSWLLVVGLALLGAIGCTSRLTVKKVTPECDEHVKGFRYYLSRPYVVVDKPILISEHIELVPSSSGKMNAGKVSAREIRHGHVTELSTAEVQLLRNQVTLAAGQAAEAAEAPSSNDGGSKGSPSGGGLSTTDAAAPSAASTASKSSASGTSNVPSTVPKETTAGPLKGSIKVIFLPDFEENYAVHNRNWLGKSEYKLNFKDGWLLSDVSGKFDSTPVAIEVMNTIDRAINSIKSIEEAEIDREKAAYEAAKRDAEAKKSVSSKDARTTEATFYQVVRRTYIKPGIYRVNKPWEADMGPGPDGHQFGLLISMGLTLHEVTEHTVGQAEKVSGKLITQPRTIK